MSSKICPSLLRTTRSSGPVIARLSSPAPSRSALLISPGLRRSFHWQSTISNAITGTQDLIINLHDITHLPWSAAIPLVAVTVGVVFRLPFTIYTQRILQQRTEFGPLLQAWNTRLHKDVQRDRLIHPSQHLSEVKTRQDKILRRIYRKLGLQEWRLYGSFLGFPFWLIAIDAVRRLCGGPRGLIGSMITGNSASPSESSLLIDTPDSAVVSSAVEHTAVIVDPTLIYEGCLWFTDLTASDPWHILPLALSVSLVRGLLPKSGEQFSDRVRIALGRRPKGKQAQTLAAAGDERITAGERARATLYVGLVGIAALVGPLTWDLPAALHLYWLSSSLANGVFVKGVRHFMPVQSKLRKRCLGVEMPVIRPQRG